MTGNRVNPPGSEFSAVVDGKPTGLAGCLTTPCAKRGACLRADPGLAFGYDFKAYVKACGACSAFIPR
jgi:hypothetical protein